MQIKYIFKKCYISKNGWFSGYIAGSLITRVKQHPGHFSFFVI